MRQKFLYRWHLRPISYTGLSVRFSARYFGQAGDRLSNNRRFRMRHVTAAQRLVLAGIYVANGEACRIRALDLWRVAIERSCQDELSVVIVEPIAKLPGLAAR